LLFGIAFAAVSVLRIDLTPLASASQSADAEWRELYVQLAAHARDGLLFITLLLIALDLFYRYWTGIVGKLLAAETRRFLIVLAVLVFATRMAWVLLSGTIPWADAQWYHELAIGLSNGLGYLNEHGRPTAYWPPGYPAFLSILYRLFGAHVSVGQVANAILSFFQVLLVYLFSRRVFSEKGARIASLLLTFSVGNAAYAGSLMSEVPLGFLLSLILYHCAKRTIIDFRTFDLVIFGLLVGLGALVRPVMLVLPIALLLTMMKAGIKWNRLLASAALMACVISVTLLPNVLRNYALFRSFVPISTNGGINLWIGNNPDATGSYMPPPPLALSGNEAEQSDAAFRAGLTWIAGHPAAAVVTLFKKVVHLYYRDDQGILFSLVRTQGSLLWPVSFGLILMANLFYYSVFGVALYQIWARRATLSPEAYLLAAVSVMMTLFYLIYFGADRFHMPLWPIGACFAAEWISANALHSPSS